MASKKFTEELFDEKTIKDDEFVKLLIIEIRKELKRIVFGLSLNSTKSPELSFLDDKIKFADIDNLIPFEDELLSNFDCLSDIPFDKCDELNEKPSIVPTPKLKSKCEKSMNIFTKENFEEMPRYVC